MTAYRAELGIGDEPVVMYAGNVGFSQSLELVVDGRASDARRDVRDQRRRRGAAVAARSRPPGCANVRFVGYQPRERLAEVLATGRHPRRAAARRASGNVSVPSKTYSILAAGRPVLAAIDAGTEVPRILAASGAGRVVPPDDPARVRRARCARCSPTADAAARDGRRRAALGRARGLAARPSPQAYVDLIDESDSSAALTTS